ncbi:MAG: 2-polyprenyl-6-methoxyphenol hydroxylase [Mycetocola sp.]|jgi:salicylate hydroxylase|nr:2-polyprenyl-6-methoxyphenol hydroxylase [Mycetocola sp.]
MGKPALRVAIVGGGIGGMSAGIALSQRGMDVQVFEQAPRLGEIGAGVLMTPNSLRLLERMGMGAALAEVGATVGSGSSYYRMDGTVIAPIQTTDSSGWNGVYGMHRADLLSVLAEHLPAGVVQTNSRCTRFEQTADSARLLFDNGKAVEADIVIAADGIHSALQQYVVEPSQPVHSGSVAYRGLIPAAMLPSWPSDVSQLWMGEGKHFLVYPVRSGSLINYVGFVPSDERAKESWSAPGDGARLASEFAGWDPRVEELLSKVEDTFWWGLYDREPLDSWTNGRLALMGDAAHPMLPHLGQGANQAIEDGVALAVMLAGVGPEQAPHALQMYETLRRERTNQVQAWARVNGDRYDSARAYENLSRRDAEIAASVDSRLWLYDYDVEERASQLAASQ